MDPVVEEKTVISSETPTGTVVKETRAANVPGADYEFAIWKAENIVWGFIGIINLLILLRFFFLLFGANNVGFVSFIYNLTNIFVAPFRGIFDSAQAGESYFDTASLLAIVMWTVIGFIIATIIRLLSTRNA